MEETKARKKWQILESMRQAWQSSPEGAVKINLQQAYEAMASALVAAAATQRMVTMDTAET